VQIFRHESRRRRVGGELMRATRPFVLTVLGILTCSAGIAIVLANCAGGE
jgi:hypothetical protein